MVYFIETLKKSNTVVVERLGMKMELMKDMKKKQVKYFTLLQDITILEENTERT